VYPRSLRGGSRGKDLNDSKDTKDTKDTKDKEAAVR
jgi:hypothetical protein